MNDSTARRLTGNAEWARPSVPQGAATVYRFPSGERPISTGAHAVAFRSNPLSGTAVNELSGTDEAEAVRAEWRAGADPAYQPARTPLGALLRELRRVSLASEPRLLGWDEIAREMDIIRGRGRPS